MGLGDVDYAGGAVDALSASTHTLRVRRHTSVLSFETDPIGPMPNDRTVLS